MLFPDSRSICRIASPRPFAVLAVVSGLVLFLGADKAAAEQPSVDAIQQAGEQFNFGRAAFKEGDYVAAADHFEQADRLAPNAKVLLLAIQSRAEAGQLARAATLAALAMVQYPEDEGFAEVRPLVDQAAKEKSEVTIKCDEPCTVLLGMRLVHGPPVRERVLFLEPGDHSVRAAFDEDRSDSQEISAFAGESQTLTFDAPEPEPEAKPAVVESEPEEPAVVSPAEDPFQDEPEQIAPEESSSGLSPVWFWSGAAATSVLAGVSVWSAIDTQNNPGEQAIKENCVQYDTSCPLYQEGLERQTRTNVLWGVTGGVLAATVVLAVLTDWEDSSGQELGDTADVNLTPWVSVGNGAAIGAAGRF